MRRYCFFLCLLLLGCFTLLHARSGQPGVASPLVPVWLGRYPAVLFRANLVHARSGLPGAAGPLLLFRLGRFPVAPVLVLHVLSFFVDFL